MFALGSSAYPKFCNFGKTVDKILGDLGGERILEISCGDEMFGQEQEFRSWSSNIFQVRHLSFSQKTVKRKTPLKLLNEYL